MKKSLHTSLALLTFVLANSLATAQTTADPAPEAITVATAPAKVTSLIKIDDKIGDGTEATPGSYVDMHYTGWLYDPKAPDRRGTKFDSSRDSGKPLTFQLDARAVIRGWDLGVKGMKVGGKRTLIIPGYLAYGSKGTNGIPPNATLLFEVEMVGAR
jgi:FKBP-type peptidyl-prolyl cis-trans isomerase FkpA